METRDLVAIAKSLLFVIIILGGFSQGALKGAFNRWIAAETQIRSRDYVAIMASNCCRVKIALLKLKRAAND